MEHDLRRWMRLVEAASLPVDYKISIKWIGGGPYSQALWTNDLDPDEEESNWPYPGEMLSVTVMHDGKTVASGVASYLDQQHGGHLAVFNIHVDEQYRRRGLAKAIYSKVEKEFGDRVLPYPGNEGGAIQDFWHDRLKNDPDTLRDYSSNIKD